MGNCLDKKHCQKVYLHLQYREFLLPLTLGYLVRGWRKAFCTVHYNAGPDKLQVYFIEISLISPYYPHLIVFPFPAPTDPPMWLPQPPHPSQVHFRIRPEKEKKRRSGRRSKSGRRSLVDEESG